MSDSANAQFHEMLTHLVTHMSGALAGGESLPPMALTLDDEGQVATIAGASDERDALRDTLKAMKKTLSAQAELGQIVACCMSYADFADQCIVAFMENAANDCTEIRLPVVRQGQSLSLDLENLSVADGSVFVFPVIN